MDNFYEYDINGPNSALVQTSGGGLFSMNHLKFEDRPKPIDHNQKNILNVKFQKNKHTEKCKLIVRQIHKELKVHYQLGTDSIRLANVNNFLSPQLKERFMK